MKIYTHTHTQTNYTLGDTIDQPLLVSADDIPLSKTWNDYAKEYYEDLPNTKKFRPITFIDNNNQLQVMYFFSIAWYARTGLYYYKCLYYDGQLIVTCGDGSFEQFFRNVRNNFSIGKAYYENDVADTYFPLINGATFFTLGTS